MSLVAAVGCAVSDEPEPAPETATTHQAVTLNERIANCGNDPRVVVGKVSVDSCVGADLFFRETFGGNGRSCGTCHRADRNFVIDPQFMQSLPSSDPLFVAEFNPTLGGLEVPQMMRQFGLILENVDGFAPDPRTRFVLRSVPHTLSLATSVTRAPDDPLSPPVERTGWSGDGAPGNGSLRDFQNGAIRQHYTRSLSRTENTDFRLASDGELSRIDTFMRRIGRLNELDLQTVRMSDAGAEAGRARFLALACNACHVNAGANAGFGTGGNRNFNTGVEASRHLALVNFPIDGGLGSAANASGSFGDGTFNAPPLIEAADTGPFFHTATRVVGAAAHNTEFATTIEQAVAFYNSNGFRDSPAGGGAPLAMSAADIDNIARFLRGLNATFNAAQTAKRLDAAAAIELQLGDAALGVEFELLRLAELDLLDAVNVLSAVNLNPTQIASFNTAISQINQAMVAFTAAQRRTLVLQALQTTTAAATAIGTNISYQIGEGTLMF